MRLEKFSARGMCSRSAFRRFSIMKSSRSIYDFFACIHHRLVAAAPFESYATAMFTGIVERSAAVIGATDGPMFRRLTLALDWADLKHGESVAVNGVCLTVAEHAQGKVGFDVITETLSKTNLGLLKEGDRAHVERALRVNDRIDGHFVQGHVDATAPLIGRTFNDR